jgi:hypothetical protein
MPGLERLGRIGLWRAKRRSCRALVHFNAECTSLLGGNLAPGRTAENVQ